MGPTWSFHRQREAQSIALFSQHDLSIGVRVNKEATPNHTQSRANGDFPPRRYTNAILVSGNVAYVCPV